ncbi:MAG TPA: type II secretion system F family protein [Actinomycetota bacterium]|nr:type II secretion system F family protein [Actinomycetota bacterium]
MSELLLLLGLVGAFGSVAAAGVAVEMSNARRRRAVQLLRSQVVKTRVSLRDEELARSFTRRAVLPLLNGLQRVALRLTPVGMRRRIATNLVAAGNAEGWDAEKVAALKLVGAFGGAALAFVLGRLAGFGGIRQTGLLAFFVTIGFLLPDGLLHTRIRRRQDEIRKALPDTLDLLTISVEAGLSFDAALAQVVQNSRGPLALEIARMLQEVQLGVSRADALRNLAKRTEVEDLNGFVLAMIQAEEFGVSTTKVLRAQAKQMREKRRQRAELIAMRVPVKLVFPLILCILPSLFVVVVGPGAIRIVRNIFPAI